MYNCLKVPTSRFRKLIASLFAFAALCVGAWGETYYWVGGTAGADGKEHWSEPANWSTEWPALTPQTDGSPVPGDDPADIVNLVSTTNITIDSNVQIAQLLIPDPNLETTSFTVTLTGSGSIEATTKIETVRAAKRDNAGNSLATATATSTLVFECNVSSPKLIMHSGGNITIESTADITSIENQGGDSPEALLKVSGTLNATSIQLSDVETRELLIEAGGSVSTTTLTGSNGSVTNNGDIEISDITNSDIDTINTAGTGTLEVAGESYYIWTGNTDSVWTKDTNWQGGKPPADAKNIIIKNVTNVPEITSAVSVTGISFDTGAKLKVGTAGSFTIKDTTSDFDISTYIDGDSSGTIVTTGKFTVSTAYSAENLTIECPIIETTRALTAHSLKITDSTDFKANVTLDTFIASGMGDKTITLTNSVIEAANITLKGSSGSFLSLVGAGATHSFKPTSLDAEYLSLDDKITLVNFSTAIENCQPAADPADDANWLAVIHNGWVIKAAKTFIFTWKTNAATTDWNTASNWDIDLVPEADCKIIIPGGCARYPVLADETYDGGSLTLSAAASTITLSGNSNLSLSGKENETDVTTLLTNEGTIKYSSDGRITDGTDTITYTGDGKILFSGAANQTFEAGTNTFTHIEINKSAGSLEINGTPTFGKLTDTTANKAAITFNSDTTIYDDVALSTTGNITVKGTLNATSFTVKNLVASADAEVTTSGAQAYTTINGNSAAGEELTLSASGVTINGNVGADTGLKKLIVNAPLIIGASCGITATEIVFAGDISGSGKTLTINADTLKSSAAPDASSTITLADLKVAADLAIQTDSASTISFAIPLFSESETGKTITLGTSGNYTFTSTAVVINPNLVTTTGSTLTASSGTITFNADLDLTNGTFDANSGTIILTAANKGTNPADFKGGGKTFNNLTISDAANLAGNNTIAGILKFTGTKPVSILGDNTIASLTASGLGDKTITFTAGSSQSVTSMTLTGTDEDHKLILSSGGDWNISCTNEPVLKFLRVENSKNNTTPETNFVAFKSTDAGNNTNWSFPDMKYIWNGNDSTAWNLKTNWKDSVIPTKGATIEIPSEAANYPKLTTDLDLNTTLVNASGDSVPYNAIITVFRGAELDLDAKQIKVGKIINNGLIKLNGNTSDQITGDTVNGTETDATPAVEYTGTGTTTYFVWDDDNDDSNGKQYTNLILNRTGAEVAEDLEVSNELTINAAASIANSKSISARGDVTSNANLIGDGKLIFTGTKDQNFTANGKTYSNLEKQGTKKLTINDNFTSETFVNTTENGTIEFKDGATINSALAFQTAASVILTGTLNSTSLTVANNFIASGAAIVDTTTTQNYNGNVTINTDSSLQLRNATDITFAANKTVSGNELNITSASNTIFNGSVELTKFSDTVAAGNIRFNAGGSITASAGQTFNTTSEVSFGNDNSDTFVIGTTTERNALTHTAGNTIINGTLTAGDITLADTSGGTMTLIGAVITLNGNLVSTGTITITNSGLFKTADGKSISFTGSSPAEAGFTQSGSGNTMLGGSLTGTGKASFARHVYLYGSAAAAFGSSGNTITIANNYNLITCRTGGTLSINAASVTANNIVFYKSSVNLNGNLFSRKDIVILGGTSYSTEDTSTGYEDEYAYDAPRPSGWSTAQYTFETQFPDTSALSRGDTSFTVASGKIFHAGKNFYINGTSLSGSAEWFIDILSNANSHICFAEAYNSTITNCTVRLHDGTTATGTSHDDSAQIPTENCTLTGCSNFDDSPFTITEAYTTRDNVVYAKFNREVRNLNGELNGAVSNFKYHYSTDNDTSYSSIKINADGSTALDDGSEPVEIYLLSATEKTWNTDATGTSKGADRSTDRNGNERSAKPYIDIPRALGSSTSTTQNAVITDRFGKRLKNYSTSTSTSTTTSGYAYGTDTTVGNETYVLDKTGPVLTAVRTGQETHETTLASQKAYDSHNFIEFIYSEPVNFGDTNNATNASKKNTADWIPAYESGISGTPNTPQNIQVSSALGYTDTASLNFRGLKQTIASGQIHTKQGGSGSDTQDVNALYRDSTHSIKYSLAGYASNVSTDGTITGSYIIWPGYIEEAVTPSGSVSGAASASTPNHLVTDCATDKNGNAVYNPQIMNKPDLTVNNNTKAGTNYGPWDTAAPVFVKGHLKGRTSDENFFETIGNGDGSTLTRLEIHVADNPASGSYNGIWLTGYGWSDTINPDSARSPAADKLIGGSRPYANTNATTGGLRYCTILNQENAFHYGIGNNTATTQNFTSIAPGASASFFVSSTTARNDIPTADDNTYIKLNLSDTNLPYKTTFTLSYDESGSYITDLAGNRLKSSSNMLTVDRTSPDFKMTFSPINRNKILLMFVKQLARNIKYSETGTPDEIPESFETILPYCFEIGTISGGFTANTDPDALQIDTSVPARALDSYSNEFYTAVELTLNREVTLDDIRTLYIRLKNAGTVNGHTYNTTSKDPLTGLDNSYVTFIQDAVGNYMQIYQVHALSDFASGIVNPLYAYNDDLEYDNENITENLFEGGSWAIHDWNEEQQNYGTLIANKPVTVIANVDQTNLTADADGKPQFTLRLYYSDSPDSGSQSDKFNADIPEMRLRLWMPTITDGVYDNGVFPAYSSVTNSNYDYIDGETIEEDDITSGFHFSIGEDKLTKFTPGKQISFLFGLFDTAGTTQETICISPILSFNGGGASSASYNTDRRVPLYLLRLKNPSDITSIDLWSFRLKNIKSQRGGVTILNNVINVNNDEKTVIKIDLPEDGKLNVMIMTLDGNIITHLNKGNLKAGEHYFTWHGKNRNGNPVARGMYFVRVIGSGIDETRKVMVVKD